MGHLNTKLGIALVASACMLATAVAKPLPPPPIHPDTLPSLARAWTLPSSFAPNIANDYAPRTILRDGVLYVYDHHGQRLVAADADSGKVLWHSPVPARSGWAFAFTPFVSDDRIFVANDGYLHAFELKTGKHKWKVGTKGVAVNGLARSKHRLFLPWIKVKAGKSLPGVMVWAIDARRGRVNWSKKYPGNMAYLAGDANGVYYVSDTGAVLGLTADRGEPRWQVRVKGRITTPPIFDGGMLYVVSARKKAGWSGSGIYAVDTKAGKLLWETKVSSTRPALFLHKGQLTVAERSGRITMLTSEGKKDWSVDLPFGEPAETLHGASTGNRLYAFSSHPSGEGYVWLVDPVKKSIIATANALKRPARSVNPGEKTVYLDGNDGVVYAYRLDRSEQPKRRSIPPDEFAEEMLTKAAGAKKHLKDLPLRLAALGAKALPAMENALSADNDFVATAAAEAIALLGARKSVSALLKALKMRGQNRAVGRSDSVVAIVEALAVSRDRKAASPLAELMLNSAQSHQRRRAAYVALGGIGGTTALAPIWQFRGEHRIASIAWEPQAFTSSSRYGVEIDDDGLRPSEEEYKKTSITSQNKAGQIYSAAISPYLGGYNDIWVGPSDLAGSMAQPWYSGLTKPETLPDRRVRFDALQVDPKGAITLQISMQRDKKWITAKPVTFSLAELTADRDGDGLTDIVEERLQTCLTHPDCDGDGLRDGEDLNPLASAKQKPTEEQELFREAFFAYYVFLKRRGLVVVDPGDDPSVEYFGRRDPILSLRRAAVQRLRKAAGLHAVDYVSFGGPYPEGGGSGDAEPKVSWGKNHRNAVIGMDIVRSGDNAVAYNVTLKKTGKNWLITKMQRAWSTD